MEAAFACGNRRTARGLKVLPAEYRRRVPGVYCNPSGWQHLFMGRQPPATPDISRKRACILPRSREACLRGFAIGRWQRNPRVFEVRAGKRHFAELNVDGGAALQVFTLPPRFSRQVPVGRCRTAAGYTSTTTSSSRNSVWCGPRPCLLLDSPLRRSSKRAHSNCRQNLRLRGRQLGEIRPDVRRTRLRYDVGKAVRSRIHERLG